MRTKKLFLKLFFTAFFLTIFIPKDVHAAQTTINLQDVPGDITISGNSDDHNVTCNGSVIAAHNPDGYVLTGRGSNIKITVNVPNTTLNLTFLDLLMENANTTNQLIIQSGIVRVDLQNRNADRNVLKNFNGDAVLINNSSRLTFTGNGKILLSGTTHAVNGGTTGDLTVACNSTGAVTLNVQNASGTPFEGDELTATSGLLRFEGPDGNTVKFGKRILYLDGAKVEADGIIEISYKDESLKNLSPGDHTITYDRDTGTSSDIKRSVGNDEKFYLTEEDPVFNRYITVDGAQRLFLDKRPAKPTNVKYESEEVAYTNKGTITLPSLDYEYKGTNGNQPTTWTTPDVALIEDLPPGNYLVRKKATDNEFASESTSIPLKLGRLLTITPPEFSEITYGDAQPSPGYFQIQNHDRQSIKISSIRQSGGNSDWYILPDNATNLNINIGRETTNTTAISLQPKPNLDAKTYKTEFTINYRTDDDPNTPKTEKVSVTFTVEPKKQPQPTIGTGEFEVKKVTYNSIELTPVSAPEGVDAVEYSIDGTKWVKDPSFTGLTGNTDYKIQVRSKGDAPNYIASEPLEVQVHTEVPAKFDFTNEQIEMPPYSDRNYTITVGNETINAQGDDKIDIKESWFDKTVTIHDVTNNYDQTLTIQKRAAAPTNLKATDETIASYHDGKITGANTSMQYKLESWEEWASCANIEKNTIENLEPGKYFVRIAPTDSKFASASAEVTIKKGKVISVEPIEFDSMTYGTVPDSKAITITNHDKENPVTIEGMSIDPNSFVISEGDKTVAADDKISNWKLQPKEKLNVGTYTAELIVNYNDSSNTTPENPEEPSNPDNPTNPENPEEPSNPDNPTNPENPEEPSNPDSPANPENPDDSENKDDSEDNKQEGADEQTRQISTKAAEDAVAIDEEKPEPLSIPVEITVTKAEQDVPPVPSEKSKTATSITLETIPNNPVTGAKAQYSKDGGKTWQDSPTFTGLTPNREYTFIARYAETDNYEASNESNGEVAITTAEKNDDDKDGVKTQANGSDSNSSNGNNSGTGTNGTNGNGTGTNSGTNGTGTDSDSSSNGVLSSAKTGDLNNIQLWVTLMIVSYLSCAVIVKNRLKKVNS